VKRRELLKGVGVGVWGLGVGDWSGALAPRLPGSLANIGIQLYTLRRDFQRDVEGTLAKVAEIGFREVEFAGYPPGTGAPLKAILERLGLTAPSSHVALEAIRADWGRALDEAAALGQRYIVVPSIGREDRQTLDAWKRVAALFNRAGEEARARKIQFAYHNHDFEFAPIEGTTGYDVLLAETDPGLVQLELDLYWMTRAGRDPLQYFAKYPGRFPLLHVKDMDATPEKGFADVGKGTIDFARIFRRIPQAGAKHFFYEQDVTPGVPLDSAKVSYQYLKQLRF
jgi:sugar phosphate isomerase/epimerase